MPPKLKTTAVGRSKAVHLIAYDLPVFYNHRFLTEFQISLVGHVVHIEPRDSFANYTIDDSTGVIVARLWPTNDNSEGREAGDRREIDEAAQYALAI